MSKARKSLLLYVTLLIVSPTSSQTQNQEWLVFDTSNSRLPHDIVSCICLDSSGTKWITTSESTTTSGNRGLVSFDGITWTVYTTSNSGLPDRYIYAMTIDGAGNKWLGTWGAGLIKFNGTNWVAYSPNNSNFPDYYVRRLEVDHQGNLWIGTGDKGLVRFDGNDWIVYNNRDSGLPHNWVRGLAFDATGELWIGTFGGGLAKFDGQNWTIYNTSNSPLPSNEVTCVAVDGAGNKWVAIYDKGLVRFDGSTWTIYDTNNTPLRANTIWTIASEGNNKVWIGTSGGGVAKFDGIDWTVYRVWNSRLPSDWINVITIDAFGNKWIGTHGGGLAIFKEGGLAPLQVCKVAGKLSYYTNGNPISGAAVEINGDITRTVSTDSKGDYIFSNLPAGAQFTVRMSKPKNCDVGEWTILTYDAALTARAVVGLDSLNSYRQRAADVDQDGHVYLYDAALIARYAVGLPPTADSRVGEWIFDPTQRSYQPLTATLVDQNYLGILLGDVDGNWSPANHVTKNFSTTEYPYLSDLRGAPAEMVTLPIFVEENRSVLSLDLTVRYPPQVLKLIDIPKTDLSQPFNLIYNDMIDQGRLRVGLYGTVPVSRGGVFINLSFKVIGKQGAAGPLVVERYQVNNESPQYASATFVVAEDLAPGKKVPEFSIQNYPNPFNPQTTVEYYMAKHGWVTITIYNLLGKELTVLVDEPKEIGRYYIY
ncbi:MAG: hypothetical protein ONB05_08890, partial [candidate division KSB1 bacterium]|nr:hypothetical protein [candidate division KSB1 bacterium]